MALHAGVMSQNIIFLILVVIVGNPDIVRIRVSVCREDKSAISVVFINRKSQVLPMLATVFLKNSSKLVCQIVPLKILLELCYLNNFPRLTRKYNLIEVLNGWYWKTMSSLMFDTLSGCNQSTL